jgi:uncharacterized protein YbjT (DUF2867 family)
MARGRILVTGATGTIGSHIVHELFRRKVNFRAAYHDPAKANNINLPGVEIVQIDNDKPETISTSLVGIEKLFLLTPDLHDTVNIIANFVNEASKAGVKQIVNLSVMGADSGFRTIGGRLHRDVEKVVEASGISYTHLRPSHFMQNFVNFYAQSIRDYNAFYLPLADAKISFVDIRDVASVAVESLISEGHGARAYTVTGPETLTCHEVAEILSVVTGRKITYVSISEIDTRQRLKEIEMPSNVIDYLVYSYKFTREGNFSMVTNMIEQVTRKRPITFKQFAAENIEAFSK